MLKKIICNKFTQQEINFHSGLNIILGDDKASNSIGKSNMLMIIDFIFGGESYITVNNDTVKNIGHHSFAFIFTFANTEYYFKRSTDNYKFIILCNDKFEKVETIELSEYMVFLKDKYNCQIDNLSFREIIGRYFRVYGKENLEEKKPIQYFDKEPQKISIKKLLSLFNKYNTLQSYEEQITELSKNKNTLKNAAKQKYIPSITTKKSFEKNQKALEILKVQMKEMEDEIKANSINTESLMSEQILEYKREKSSLNTQLNIYINRLIRTQNNLDKKFSSSTTQLNKFKNYFPSLETKRIEEINEFHKTISKNLTKEFKTVEKNLQSKITLIKKQMVELDNKINEELTITDSSKILVSRVVEIISNIKQLEEENKYYNQEKDLTADIKSYKETFEKIKQDISDETCSSINIKMHELNEKIYTDGRKSPQINIHNDSYIFNTANDTGTGTAYANLLTFDLALLSLTDLPAIAHDLPLLKNIEDYAIETIVQLYSEYNKQIFIVLDKVSSYDEKTAKIIKNHCILQLSKDKLLFPFDWKTK